MMMDLMRKTSNRSQKPSKTGSGSVHELIKSVDEDGGLLLDIHLPSHLQSITPSDFHPHPFSTSSHQTLRLDSVPQPDHPLTHSFTPTGFSSHPLHRSLPPTPDPGSHRRPNSFSLKSSVRSLNSRFIRSSKLCYSPFPDLSQSSSRSSSNMHISSPISVTVGRDPQNIPRQPLQSTSPHSDQPVVTLVRTPSEAVRKLLSPHSKSRSIHPRSTPLEHLSNGSTHSVTIQSSNLQSSPSLTSNRGFRSTPDLVGHPFALDPKLYPVNLGSPPSLPNRLHTLSSPSPSPALRLRSGSSVELTSNPSNRSSVLPSARSSSHLKHNSPLSDHALVTVHSNHPPSSEVISYKAWAARTSPTLSPVSSPTPDIQQHNPELPIGTAITNSDPIPPSSPPDRSLHTAETQYRPFIRRQTPDLPSDAYSSQSHSPKRASSRPKPTADLSPATVPSNTSSPANRSVCSPPTPPRHHLKPLFTPHIELGRAPAAVLKRKALLGSRPSSVALTASLSSHHTTSDRIPRSSAELGSGSGTTSRPSSLAPPKIQPVAMDSCSLASVAGDDPTTVKLPIITPRTSLALALPSLESNFVARIIGRSHEGGHQPTIITLNVGGRIFTTTRETLVDTTSHLATFLLRHFKTLTPVTNGQLSEGAAGHSSDSTSSRLSLEAVGTSQGVGNSVGMSGMPNNRPPSRLAETRWRTDELAALIASRPLSYGSVDGFGQEDTPDERSEEPSADPGRWPGLGIRSVESSGQAGVRESAYSTMSRISEGSESETQSPRPSLGCRVADKIEPPGSVNRAEPSMKSASWASTKVGGDVEIDLPPQITPDDQVVCQVVDVMEVFMDRNPGPYEAILWYLRHQSYCKGGSTTETRNPAASKPLPPRLCFPSRLKTILTNKTDNRGLGMIGYLTKLELELVELEEEARWLGLMDLAKVVKLELDEVFASLEGLTQRS